MTRAVPRLVFGLSCSTFPLCSSWPGRHKENVITGAGSAVTKGTKQTSPALPEHSPNLPLLRAREGAEQQPALSIPTLSGRSRGEGSGGLSATFGEVGPQRERGSGPGEMSSGKCHIPRAPSVLFCPLHPVLRDILQLNPRPLPQELFLAVALLLGDISACSWDGRGSNPGCLEGPWLRRA